MDSQEDSKQMLHSQRSPRYGGAPRTGGASQQPQLSGQHQSGVHEVVQSDAAQLAVGDTLVQQEVGEVQISIHAELGSPDVCVVTQHADAAEDQHQICHLALYTPRLAYDGVKPSHLCVDVQSEDEGS